MRLLMALLFSLLMWAANTAEAVAAQAASSTISSGRNSARPPAGACRHPRAPALKAVIESYASRARIKLKPEYEADNLSMAMSLVASTGGITLLPQYAENLLSPSVISRPLQGDVPTIDLVIGYNKANTSALLKRFLARTDELVSRTTQRAS